MSAPLEPHSCSAHVHVPVPTCVYYHVVDPAVHCHVCVCSMPTMMRKNDLVCWVFLSDDQERIYRDFLQQNEIKEVSGGGGAD